MSNATDGWLGVRVDLDHAFKDLEDRVRGGIHEKDEDAVDEQDAATKDAVNGNGAASEAGGGEEGGAKAKSVGGRPQALDDFNRGRVCSLLGIGLSQKAVAAVVGCHQATISRALKNDPKFASDVEFSKQKARMLPLLQVMTASRNSWRAAAWLLRYVDEQQAKTDFDPEELFACVDRLREDSQEIQEGES